MSEKYTVGKTNNEERKCVCTGKCATMTRHTVLASVRYSWGTEDDDIRGMTDSEIVQCKGCDTVSFRQSDSNTEDYIRDEETGEIDYLEQVRTYPSRLDGRRVLEDHRVLPNEVREAYLETHTALCGKLPRLATVGVRMVVELVCKHMGAKGKTLELRLFRLSCATQRNIGISGFLISEYAIGICP